MSKAISLLILTALFQITLVTARIHLTTHEIASDHDQTTQLIQIFPSVTNQLVNSTTRIIDNGIHDQDADFASDIIALIFSTLSVFSTCTILILFYLEQSWVFGNEKFFTNKNISEILQIGSNRVQQKRQVINKKKRQFIRRCMLALLIADLISSLSRILFILWWWLCSRVAPDAMFNRRLVPVVNSNVSSNQVQNHVGFQMDFNPIQIESISIVPFMTLDQNLTSGNTSNITTLIASYELKVGATIINRFFAHVNFAASLTTATWCVVVAFAIYATTTNVKWMEKKLSPSNSLNNSLKDSFSNKEDNESYGGATNDDEENSIHSEMNENAAQDPSMMSDHLVSIDLRQSNQSSMMHTSQLHQHKFHEISSFKNDHHHHHRKLDQSMDLDSSAPKRNSMFMENMNKLKKMSPFMRYEIAFHIVAWSVGLFVFLVLFIFRFITTLVETAKSVKTGFVTAVYISWNIYFTLTVIVNFILLIIIWRYVGKYLNSTQLQVIPKKETKRRQLSVILRLSLLILPYVICGVFEVAYWYYNIFSMLLNSEDDTFILVFYNFFFNGLVPLRGFFFGIAFLLGSSEIRAFVKYIICCGHCCYKKKVDQFKNYQLSQSLLMDDPNNSRNFQALIVESSTDNLVSHDHYNQLRSGSVIKQSNSGSSIVDQASNSPNESTPSPREYLNKSLNNSSSSTSRLRSGTMRPTPHNVAFNTIIQQQEETNLEQVTFGRLETSSSPQYYQTKKRSRTFMPSTSQSNTSSVGSPQSNSGQSPVGSNSPRMNNIQLKNETILDLSTPPNEK